MSSSFLIALRCNMLVAEIKSQDSKMAVAQTCAVSSTVAGQHKRCEVVELMRGGQGGHGVCRGVHEDEALEEKSLFEAARY